MIEPTNELKQLQSVYKEEENRILLAMCQCVAAHLLEVVAAVRAVALVDVFAAKAKLGRRLRGIIPEVSCAHAVILVCSGPTSENYFQYW